MMILRGIDVLLMVRNCQADVDELTAVNSAADLIVRRSGKRIGLSVSNWVCEDPHRKTVHSCGQG